MRVFDVTVPLRQGLPTYAGEPGVTLDYPKRLERGDPYNVSALSLGSHTGTHIDAPYHFIDGAPTVDEIPLDALIGPCVVVEHSGDSHVSADDLDRWGLPPDATRLLIKTRNSRLWDDDRFREDYIALSVDAAKWIVDRGIVLVGIDYMSIEEFGATRFVVHETLLEHNVVIVEWVDLRGVSAGSYQMVCAPLLVVGAEGAPARVLLWTGD
ncbi:MAG: cyclase family protein [Dehalococcoidia bacterium]